jgi:diguanylate cyclase (GGDEF)-like protein
MSLEEKVRERTKELDSLARVDTLTGLLNTRQLNELLLTATRIAQRENTPIAVVYIDVNDFKIVNDTKGHQHGDEILRAVGNAISGCARPEDFCFRYGGDEFLIILTNCTEKQARDVYVTSLQKRMTEAGVSLSIGVAQSGPHRFLDENTLIKLADEDMYKSKKAHKAAKVTTDKSKTVEVLEQIA